MIEQILTHYAESLDKYLARTHPQSEGLATVGMIGSVEDESPNKVVVSLLNLERETAGGISYARREGNAFIGKVPPMMFNLYIMLAAVYDSKRYAESLAVLSEALHFIQSMPLFTLNGNTYSVEIETMSTRDLHNMWITMGGQYYPSVICRVRRLMVDSNTVISRHTLSE